MRRQIASATAAVLSLLFPLSVALPVSLSVTLSGAVPARADILVPFHQYLGNWFIYADDGVCSAVTKSWGRSLYLSQGTKGGWRLSTDIYLGSQAGPRQVSIDGTAYTVDLTGQDGLAGFAVAGKMNNALVHGLVLDIEPSSPNGMFSIHRIGEVMNAVMRCTAHGGNEDASRHRAAQQLFKESCPAVEDMNNPYGYSARVRFTNRTDAPVMLYRVSREKDWTFLGVVSDTREVDTSVGAVFQVLDARGGCLGTPLVVGRKGQEFVIGAKGQ